MLIEVTAEDIEQGEHTHGTKCPVARALTRANGEPCGATYTHLRIGIPAREIIATPQPAYDFMNAFDDGLPVEPFTFEIPYERS